MINEKRDYDGRCSSRTSRPSARPLNAPASYRFKSAVLKLPHINQVLHHHGCNNNVQQQEHVDEDAEDQEQEMLSRSKGKSRAFHGKECGEKHHQKKKEKGKKDQYQYRYHRCGQQAQQLSACKNKATSSNGIRENESTNTINTNGRAVASTVSNQRSKHKKGYKRACLPFASRYDKLMANKV